MSTEDMSSSSLTQSRCSSTYADSTERMSLCSTGSASPLSSMQNVSFTEEDTSIFVFMEKLHINRKRTIVDRYKALACDMKKEDKPSFVYFVPKSKWVNSVNIKSKPIVAKLLYHPLMSRSQVSSRYVSYASQKKCVSIPCTSSAGVSRFPCVYA